MRKLFFVLLSLIAYVCSVSAQTYTYSGIVVDASTNEPLIGATILPIGGGSGTATDIDGRFSIEVPAKVKNATFSYVGFAPQTLPLTPDMTVKLSETASNLDEVMVVAYGTAKKSAYTGSASVVKADDLETALVSNATDALNGKVAGVQIQSFNGQPGSDPKVLIRGVGSINASTAPLYVVDGIPYDGSISNLNTMDIESMTVLKDAASAALYGARGANGVILVTTKKGQSGSAKITVDARWGGNSRATSRYDMIRSTDQFTELVYQSLYNGYYYNQTMSADRAHAMANAGIVPSLGYQVYTVPNSENLIMPNGFINPNATLGYQEGNYYYRPDDWYKEQFRNGLRQEYNVSATGGNDKFNYFLSGTYLGDEGLIEGSHFKRLGTRATVDYQLKPWLKLGTNLSYTYTNSGNPGENTKEDSSSSGNVFFVGDQMAPYYPMYVRDAAGNIMHNEISGLPIYDYGDGASTPYKRNFMAMSNPAGSLAYDTNDYLSDVFNGKWYALITPLEGLSITGTVGYYLDVTRYHELGNPFYGQSASYGGSAYQVFERTRSINLQGLAQYRRTFAEKHDIDILVGYESYDLNIEDLQGAGYNLYLPNSWAINNTIDDKNPYGYFINYDTRGIFGRVNYAFDNRYYVSASVRRDASSCFAPGHRWGTFWSLSAAWDLAQEHFMDTQRTWLDMFKVKASFGQQGNDNLGRNDNQCRYYAWADQYRIQGADGVWSDGTLYYKGNPDITWETSNNFNAGVDFSFLQGMVSGTIEYYSRQTSDMLYNKPVAPSLGYSSIPMNVGSMRNNGVEVELNVRPIKTRNVTWNINANITTLNNKVIKLHPDLNGELLSGNNLFREGDSMYQFYLVDYAGVDPTTGLALYWDGNPRLDDEGNVMKDKWGHPIVDEFVSSDWSHAYSNNRKATGNIMPKAYGGFGTSLEFFGFDFSMSFAYQFGGKIWDYTYQDLMHVGNTASMGQNWHKDITKAWTPQNTNTNVPRLDSQDQYANSTSTRWLTSSNYLSLQNVTLGYNLPDKLVKKLALSKVRIYGAGENLFLLSARKGMDPRQGFLNADAATYGAIRCISGGIRVEF